MTHSGLKLHTKQNAAHRREAGTRERFAQRVAACRRGWSGGATGDVARVTIRSSTKLTAHNIAHNNNAKSWRCTLLGYIPPTTPVRSSAMLTAVHCTDCKSTGQSERLTHLHHQCIDQHVAERDADRRQQQPREAARRAPAGTGNEIQEQQTERRGNAGNQQVIPASRSEQRNQIGQQSEQRL